jgi:hypothetical protein
VSTYNHSKWTSWAINMDVFERIMKTWGPVSGELFADAQNHRMEPYTALDGGTMGCNAFEVRLSMVW